MKRFMRYALYLIAVLTALSFTARAQSLKIGYVNSAKILQEFHEAQEAQRKLDAIGSEWQQELDKMDKELQQKYEDYQKKEPLLKEDEKRTQRDDILALQQKEVQFRQQKFGNTGELAAATDSILRPIKQKVMNVIQKVAKDNKVQFMFDRNDQILVLLYGDAKFDYTFKVIDILKREATN